MKKTFIFLSSLIITLNASAQAPIRTSLFEGFMGENCGPSASIDPALNITLSTNSVNVIALKWEPPIPSAPTNTSSLYKTNQAETDWRYRGTPWGGYGYPSQWTPTNSIQSGINMVPCGRIDGQHQWTFGATSDHAFYMSSAVISSAQAQPTNFSIAMTPSWNPNFSNCIVSVTVTSSSSFTSVGNLMYRLCLIEKVITFSVAPGTNGQTTFENEVRKSYPTTITGTAVTAMGTPLSNTWTAGQSQSFTVNCNIPNYINNLSQMAFVGFVQDDGDRKVWQAARTAQAVIPNDIKVVSVAIPPSCSGSISASLLALNQGTNAITAMTIAPYIDGVLQSPYFWSGNIAMGASVAIALPGYTASTGLHTFSTTITDVSGGDPNTTNNSGKCFFGVSDVTSTGIAEPFAMFPPAYWYVLNYNFGPKTWTAAAVGGYGASSSCIKYEFYSNNILTDSDDLFFPAMNLTGVANPVLTFEVAYAQYGNQSDQLDVMVSTNCGASWTNVYSKQGYVLATTPSVVNSFTPSSTQWRTETISLPALANQASVLVKFVTTNANGNNLYIDNVNLGEITSINKVDENTATLEVYPNPVVNNINLRVIAQNSHNCKLLLKNALGQIVYNSQCDVGVGENNISIDCKNFAGGVYFVSLESDGKITTGKIIIAK
jgi:hypothetical protein